MKSGSRAKARGGLILQLCTLLMPVMLLASCGVERSYEAALLATDIAAGKEQTRLKTLTPTPRRSAVTLPVGGRQIGGDLYLPDRAPLAGLLFLPGAAEKGKDDPRVQALAMSLARARFAVLIPDLESFRLLHISSADIGHAADAFSWLVAQKELAPGGRAGILSSSYASGPAFLAALKPEIAAKARFIMAVGGYYDLRSVLTFFTTGYFKEKGRWRHREPNSYGKWVFVLSNVNRLSDPSDRQLFQQAAERKMADLNATLQDLVPRLGPEGRSLYDFLENRDPNRAQPLMDRLPPQIRREIHALNVAEHDLSRFKPHAILVHGYDDDIIPYTESVSLAGSLPPRHADLFLVYGLHHVDLQPRLADKYRLWRALTALLRERG